MKLFNKNLEAIIKELTRLEVIIHFKDSELLLHDAFEDLQAGVRDKFYEKDYYSDYEVSVNGYHLLNDFQIKLNDLKKEIVSSLPVEIKNYRNTLELSMFLVDLRSIFADFLNQYSYKRSLRNEYVIEGKKGHPRIVISKTLWHEEISIVKDKPDKRTDYNEDIFITPFLTLHKQVIENVISLLDKKIDIVKGLNFQDIKPKEPEKTKVKDSGRTLSPGPEESKKKELQKNPEDRWLTSQEVCEILKISSRTLQTYRDRKQISFSQTGPKIYYKKSDIDKYLDDHYIKSRE